MIASEYYRQMRQLALTKRAEHGIETTTLNATVVRGIYKSEGIRIDKWDTKSRKIKAAYFCDDTDCSVLIKKSLPKIPYLFALVHELKHHYVDRDSIRGGKLECGNYNANKVIEIGAEVFASEFIYPEDDMRQAAEAMGCRSGTCTPEKIVEFKRACPATVSYAYVIKRFEWYGFIAKGEHKSVQFQKLESALHGEPIYKQNWFIEQRQSRSSKIQ